MPGYIPLKLKIELAIIEIQKALDKFDPEKSISPLVPGELTNLIYNISYSCGTPKQLQSENSEQDPNINALIEQFRDLVGQGLARVEVIQKYNREKILNENPNISGNIDNPNDIFEKLKKTVLDCVKKDDHVNLKNTLDSFVYHPQIRSLYSYALRVAACGNKTQCLQYLIKSRCANILEQAPNTKKIALHFAIEKAHLDAIQSLLWATDSADFFAPCRQLLIGELGFRPIDLLINHPNADQKRSMINIVLEVINNPRMNDFNMSDFDLIYRELTRCLSTDINKFEKKM